MNKPTYNIAVTGLNAIDSPGPGVAVIRGLRESKKFNVRIIGLSYEALEPGIYMHNLVDKTYQIPYPSAGTESLFARIEYIHQKENLHIIIPNFDAELYSFIRIENRLLTMGIKMFLPTMKQFEERLKANLDEFGKKYEIDVPESKPVFKTTEINDVASEFGYPVVVKGKFYDAGIAYNLAQANTWFGKISSKWGLPIIIQKFISGTEYNVAGLGDGKGNAIAVVPMRKQYITDKGKAWSGISIADERLIEMAKKFIRMTRWKGPFELEIMEDKDNTLYLLEINPRMPAWIYLSVGVGQNIPEATALLALEQNLEPYTEILPGKMFIRYAWDMIIDISDFQHISTLGEL